MFTLMFTLHINSSMYGKANDSVVSINTYIRLLYSPTNDRCMGTFVSVHLLVFIFYDKHQFSDTNDGLHHLIAGCINSVRKCAHGLYEG